MSLVGFCVSSGIGEAVAQRPMTVCVAISVGSLSVSIVGVSFKEINWWLLLWRLWTLLWLFSTAMSGSCRYPLLSVRCITRHPADVEQVKKKTDCMTFDVILFFYWLCVVFCFPELFRHGMRCPKGVLYLGPGKKKLPRIKQRNYLADVATSARQQIP
jgi:hypothetical protein